MLKVNGEQPKGKPVNSLSKLPLAVRRQFSIRPSVRPCVINKTDRRVTTTVCSQPEVSKPKPRASVVSSLPGFLRPTLSSIAKTKALPLRFNSQKDDKKLPKLQEEEEKEEMNQHPPTENMKKTINNKPSIVHKQSTEQSTDILKQHDTLTEANTEHEKMRGEDKEQQQSDDANVSGMDQSDETTLNTVTMIEAGTEENVHPACQNSPEKCATSMTAVEESMSKCSVDVHSTPKYRIQIQKKKAPTSKRTLKLTESNIMSSDSFYSPPRSNNYSFSITRDESPLADCDGYEYFSTPIKNFSSAVANPTTDDDSIYFTPCGEI